MALQDLTPQLRTRLSRVERAVGWFVILAAALLLFGFGYYIYNTAESRGWFKIKAPFYTYTESATGLKPGDPVMLMGLEVGRITRMEPMRPWFGYNIYVEFEIKEPYYGYLWSVGTSARVATADLLGKRVLEVTKGTAGHPAYMLRPVKTVSVAEIKTALPEWQKWRLAQDIFQGNGTNPVVAAWSPLSNSLPGLEQLGVKEARVIDGRETVKQNKIAAIWNEKAHQYDPFFKTNMYYIAADESPAVTERIEALIAQVQTALPNVFNLTNQLSTVLSNAANLTSNLNEVAVSLRPVATNLTAGTAHLDHPGALGEWILPTNIAMQLETTLGNANATVVSVNTNLTEVIQDIGRSLDNLADLTSNLNAQVQHNTNILSNVSKAVVDTDDLVQGLKRHWLFRSAFKSKATNTPAKRK
jgi:ABC-type transporter Mla subunit MlaD